MADTGAPWNIPYVEPTDLVRDYPAADEAQADAIAAGLTAAGGLVEVKSALFTGTQTASVAPNANVAVTDLTITHTLADASNTLVISAFVGVLGESAGLGRAGIAVAVDGTLINIGALEGSRLNRTSAGGQTSPNSSNRNVTSPSIAMTHAPGDVSEHVYTLRAINLDASTRTLFINRNEQDDDGGSNAPRGVSSLVIQEVKV